jgi:hypothetical protein
MACFGYGCDRDRDREQGKDYYEAAERPEYWVPLVVSTQQITLCLLQPHLRNISPESTLEDSVISFGA